MKINRCLLGMFLLVFWAGGKGYAQEQEQKGDSTRRYASHEQWFLQVQGGANYMFAENTRFVSINRVLAPSYVVSVGKNLSTLWGLRLQLAGGGDKAIYYPKQKNSPRYSLHHIGGIAEVTLNLTHLFNRTKRGEEKPLNFLLMAGPGLWHTYGFDRKDVANYSGLNEKARNHFMFYVGVEMAFHINENWDINAELSTDWMRDSYNGVVDDLPVDFHMNGLLGLRYTFGNKNKTGKR